MNFIEFQKRAKNYPLFKTVDVFKWFPAESRPGILNQLNLWGKKRYIKHIRRGVYCLSGIDIDEPFVLAGFLYSPSYVSLESALNFYGMIPDVPLAVTSVSTIKTKTFHTKSHGVFFYHHIKPELFFGFSSACAANFYSYPYRVAKPEKALFDFLYLRTRGIKNAPGFVDELRLDIHSDFNFREFKKWTVLIDKKRKVFHEAAKIIQKYGSK